VRLYFRVDDIEAAAAQRPRPRRAVFGQPDYESGGTRNVVDDQGLRFDLFPPQARLLEVRLRALCTER